MPSNRAILLGRCITIASLTLFLVSGLFMALRVSEYYKLNPPPRFLFQQIKNRKLTVWGKPLQISDAPGEDGRAALKIEFAGAELQLPCHAPKVGGLEELDGYDDWVALAAYAPLRDGRVNLDMSKPGDDLSLVLVSRNAAPGHEDDMGGLVGRKLWTFDFVEFHPDGTLARRVLQFPAYKYATDKKYLPALELDANSKVEAIEERSWEFQAALLAIPKLHISNYRYRNTGVNAMGWTLPGTGIGMMGAVGGFVLWQGGRVGARRSVLSAPKSAPAS